MLYNFCLFCSGENGMNTYPLDSVRYATGGRRCPSPAACDGLNWQSALSALGQLLLTCTFTVGWMVLIHESDPIYRILHHMRHTPTRIAIGADLVAAPLLLSVVFFSLSLSLAIM
jgi:hypothetical protein